MEHDHPLLLEEEMWGEKVPLEFSEMEASHPISMDECGGLFQNFSKKGRTDSQAASERPKKSSPIEIKGGSPAKNAVPESEVSRGQVTRSAPTRRSFIFRALTRRNSSQNQQKHSKLDERWVNGGDRVLDGVTFSVKFIGSTLIEKATSAEAAEATKTVIQMMKAGQKSSRILLTVCANGITLSDASSQREFPLFISIYDIAHCGTDAAYPSVFSFIATNENDINECYCFSTNKRKMAKHITLTIAQAFNAAFELWQGSSSSVEAESNLALSQPQLIVGSSDSARSNASDGTGAIRDWVSFTEKKSEEEKLSELMSLVSMTPATVVQPPPPSLSRRRTSTRNSIDDPLIQLH